MSGVTYVTLLLSFARGHFVVYLTAHFEGIRVIETCPNFNHINRIHIVVMASIQNFHQVQRPAAVKLQ